MITLKITSTSKEQAKTQFGNLTYLNRPDRVSQFAEHGANIPNNVRRFNFCYGQAYFSFIYLRLPGADIQRHEHQSLDVSMQYYRN